MAHQDIREEEPSLRFTPSRVDGLNYVSEVVVHPDRLELFSEGE